MAGLDDLFSDIWEIFQPKKKKITRQEYDNQIPRGSEPLILTPKINRSPTLYDTELPAVPGKDTQRRRRTKEVMREELPAVPAKSTNALSFRNSLWADQERLLSMEEEIKRLTINFTANQKAIRDIIRREYMSLWLEWKTGQVSLEDQNKLKFLHYITFEYYAANLARDPARTYQRAKPSLTNAKFLSDAWFGNTGLKPENLEYPYIDTRINAPRDLFWSAVYNDVLKSLSSGNTFQQYGMSFDSNTLFSNGNVTLVVKDAKWLNVQLVYRYWKLQVAAYVSPWKWDNTPQWLFMLKDHVVADFVNKDDKWDLMPSAIRLYPWVVRNRKLTFDVDDGFRSHGNPISKNLHQYGITWEKISSWCFRTPWIAQMLNYHITLDDTNTYLLYDPTIKLSSTKIAQTQIAAPIVSTSWSTEIDVNTLNIPSILETNLKLLGVDEMDFMRKFFKISEKDTKGFVKKILEVQSKYKILGTPWVIDASTLQKIYTQYYFLKTENSDMALFAKKLDAILWENDEKDPQDDAIMTLRELVSQSYSRLWIHTWNIYARYTAHRFINAAKRKGDAFSKDFFYWSPISPRFYQIVSSDTIDTETQKKWLVLVDTATLLGKVEYPDLLNDFAQIHWVTLNGSQNMLFIVKSKDGKGEHVVAYIDGKLASWNKFYAGINLGSVQNLQDLADGGAIPYLYYSYLQSQLWGRTYRVQSLF